jgi:hypothetical protein
MAYNNGFPMNYQQFLPQYQTQPQAAQIPQLQGTQMSLPNPQNGIIWVQGEAGAKSYLVAPNNTVQLWDSENQVIYLKSADASGMPSMKILDYTIRETGGQSTPAVAQAPSMDNYVTRDELAEFEDRIKSRLDKLTPKESASRRGAKDE